MVSLRSLRVQAILLLYLFTSQQPKGQGNSEELEDLEAETLSLSTGTTDY